MSDIFSQGDNVVIQNNDFPLNTSRNMEYVSSSSPLSNSNDTEIKDPQSSLKDIRINNINRLIIGQLNINSLRNKFEQLSTMINENIDIFMISETKLDETFPAAQSSLQGFCDPCRSNSNRNGAGIMLYIRGYTFMTNRKEASK